MISANRGVFVALAAVTGSAMGALALVGSLTTDSDHAPAPTHVRIGEAPVATPRSPPPAIGGAPGLETTSVERPRVEIVPPPTAAGDSAGPGAASPADRAADEGPTARRVAEQDAADPAPRDRRTGGGDGGDGDRGGGSGGEAPGAPGDDRPDVPDADLPDPGLPLGPDPELPGGRPAGGDDSDDDGGDDDGDDDRPDPNGDDEDDEDDEDSNGGNGELGTRGERAESDVRETDGDD